MNLVTQIVWKDIEVVESYEELVEKVIQECFEVEKIDPTSFYICVTLTNPENIKQMNQQYRNINQETDVLSFPMFEKWELDHLFQNQSIQEIKLQEPILQDILGDIVISIPRVQKQAEEYGHSFEREFAYMLVHGFYHLRGYDHIQEEEKKQMRQKEEFVLDKLKITR